MNLLQTIDKEFRKEIIAFYNLILMGTQNEKSVFNTLVKSGYLKNKSQEDREKKIDLINE